MKNIKINCSDTWLHELLTHVFFYLGGITTFLAFLYMPKPFAIPSQWSGTVLTVAFIVAFLGGCIGVCVGAYIANKLSAKSNQCMVVHSISSESKPQVSDAISGENPEPEQTGTKKSVDDSDEK